MATGDRFTEITLEEMGRFLKQAFRALKPKKGESRGEVYYDLNLSDENILVRVWTSIRPHSGSGAGVGEDAIRVTLITGKGKPLMPKGKIVMRTKNWRSALQDRIEDLLEVYESKAEYWKERRQQRDNGHEETAPTERLTPNEGPPLRSVPPPRDITPKSPDRAKYLTGGWGKLPSGDWGAQVPAGAHPGDEAMISTKGGQKKKIILVEKVKSTHYGDLWTVQSARMASGEPGDDAGEADGSAVEARLMDVAHNVATRFLARM